MEAQTKTKEAPPTDVPSESPEKSGQSPDAPTIMHSIAEHALSAVDIDHDPRYDQLVALVKAYQTIRESLEEFKQQADVGKRRVTRLKYKTQFATPIYDLAKEYMGNEKLLRSFLDDLIATYVASGSGAEANTKFLTLCYETIVRELCIDTYKQTLNSEKRKYRDPLEDEIKKGVDIVIMNQPTVVVSHATKVVLKHEGNLPSFQVPPTRNPAFARLWAARQYLQGEINTAIVRKPAAPKTPDKTVTPPIRVIRASLPNHRIGLVERNTEPPYDHPEDMQSTRAEELAVRIIEDALGDSDIDGYKLSAQGAGDLIIQSIDTTKDDGLLVALKRLAAKLCDSRLVSDFNGLDSANYKNIIQHGKGELRASGLRDFITYMYEWSHPNGNHSAETISQIMDTISGFRVEASVVKLALAAGYEVREATQMEDGNGVDLFINGVPFDIKSSAINIRAARERAEFRRNPARHHSIKLVPPITAKDFAGNLVISDETAKRLVDTTPFVEMVNKAIAEHRVHYQQNDSSSVEENL